MFFKQSISRYCPRLSDTSTPRHFDPLIFNLDPCHFDLSDISTPTFSETPRPLIFKSYMNTIVIIFLVSFL